MKLSQIPEGHWFHDPNLHLEGKVERQGEAGTTVRLHRPRTIIIHGEPVATVPFTRPELRSAAWDVEPGRMH